MKKSRISDSQIPAVIKQAESGVPVPEHGISSATYYVKSGQARFRVFKPSPHRRIPSASQQGCEK